ncbi:chaperonin GroS [Corynebacterium striatum ATCC 6940]|nr:chaperonin GroS [Corynebacterium striatum ATCC 6940]
MGQAKISYGGIIMANIKPLEDKVLVQIVEAETTTASGLVIPDSAKEKPQEATVVAVGPGRWNEDGDERIALDVKEGDTVIFSKYGGTELKYDGQEYLLLSARDLLAVIEK